MSQSIEQINKLRDYINKTKADNYPITEHLLEKATDYHKNLYFKIICMVIQYSENILMEQTMLLQRLVKGCNAENSVEDYMRQALEVEIEDYKEFAEQLSGNLKYAFVMDVLIISNLSKCEDKYNQFLAELFESIGITVNELLYISQVCKSILHMDAAELENAQKNKPRDVLYNIIRPYLYFAGTLSDTQELLHYYCNSAKELRNLDNFYTEVISNTVIYENLKIDLSEVQLKFIGCLKVVFKHCEIIGEKKSIIFESVINVEFENCSFYGFQKKVINASSLKSLSLKECTFSECGFAGKHPTSSVVYGGVIYISDKMGSVYVNNCKFSNCFIENTGSFRPDCYGVVFYGDSDTITIINNEFNGCKAIGNGELINNAVLFYGRFSKVTKENNTGTGYVNKLMNS